MVEKLGGRVKTWVLMVILESIHDTGTPDQKADICVKGLKLLQILSPAGEPVSFSLGSVEWSRAVHLNKAVWVCFG